MSRSTGSYGGAPGENSEELVKELLQKSGWSVKELRKASDRGRAPMLEGSELRLVDFQIHNDGRRTRYVEVKSKKQAIEYGIKNERRHGWEKANHDDYQAFAREYTQDPVYVFVHERSSGVILRQRVRNLSPVQTMQDGDRLSAYNTSDPIVFFRRGDFDVVTDDESDEWSSPRELVEPLDAAVSGFDLDPCSGAESSPFAAETYTEADDGLSQPWHGDVWVNPPYSEMGEWTDKVVTEAAQDRTDTICYLCKGDSSTDWWQKAAWAAEVICAVDHRLEFGDGGNSAPFASHVVVFGESTPALEAELSEHGTLLRPEVEQ